MTDTPLIVAIAIGVPAVLCGLLLFRRDQKQWEARVADVFADAGMQPGLGVPQDALCALRDGGRAHDVVARTHAFFPCAWMRVGPVEVCVAVYRGVWWTNRAHNFTHLFAFVRHLATDAMHARDSSLSYESRTMTQDAWKQWEVVEGPRARRAGGVDEAAIREFLESLRTRFADHP